MKKMIGKIGNEEKVILVMVAVIVGVAFGVVKNMRNKLRPKYINL